MNTTMDAVDWNAFFGLFYNVRVRPARQADTAHCTGLSGPTPRDMQHCRLLHVSERDVRRWAMSRPTSGHGSRG